MANPFEGLKRRRLPGMHMIAALEGEVPLRDALSGFFFAMLHDKYTHTCLIRQAEEKIATERDDAIRHSHSPEDMFLGSVFGNMTSMGLALEEWSYLPDDEAFVFSIIADTAIEQTQRWISADVEPPRMIPRGPLVARPDWAIRFYSSPVSHLSTRQETLDYVARLRQEVGADSLEG